MFILHVNVALTSPNEYEVNSLELRLFFNGEDAVTQVTQKGVKGCE